MDTIPRISRAQSMDALSSMSNIAGYKAALLGANHLDRYLPMMMTAAGTIPPAKVLVLRCRCCRASGHRHSKTSRVCC
ncbi:hypothetical protein [Rhodohalobacter sp.]|uniref:hypothetical protein n=1 Tax=Rhodohalobacter sp. TaxID=1974210 RepID=UPI002ACEB175|nr:hypothetical protein [Rhodohalobacter sp.]MDZ7758521.1 hypothetical protein [Rhodohalobacter sp.]